MGLFRETADQTEEEICPLYEFLSKKKTNSVIIRIVHLSLALPQLPL